MITYEQVIAAIAEFYKSGTGNGGMRKALESYEASKWVSIEDQKPLPRQIVMNSNNVMAYWEDGKWKGVDGFVISPNAQYWQPLPEFKEP